MDEIYKVIQINLDNCRVAQNSLARNTWVKYVAQVEHENVELLNERTLYDEKSPIIQRW